MEESELDEWFNEQREKLEEKVYAGLSGKNPKKARDDFDVAYKQLIAEFQKRQGKIYDHQVRAAKLHAPIEAVKSSVSRFFKSIADWFKAKKLAIKKWFFDRKIKKILRDKSDL